MKVSALQRFRRKLAQDEPVYGLWLTLESPSICEMAVALGLDWIVIDAEHGHLDWKDIVEHLRTTVRSDTVALVRLAEVNAGLIKRALDIGADGVVLPWIETRGQLEEAVAMAHYPPSGRRGIGAERATCWGQCFSEHVEDANENVLVVPIIETVEAGRNARQLAQVDGVDVFFFGPADYSSTAGYPGQWEGPGVAEQIEKAKSDLRSAGKYCGVVAANDDDLGRRKQQGFQMLGLGLDAGLLLRSLKTSLEKVGRNRPIRPGFTLDSDPIPPQPLARPPMDMKPDRREVMTRLGSGVTIEIAAGVSFEALVGKHTRARNLTTGIVTMEPDGCLPYHRHTFGESVTLLSGQAMFEVEGRMYTLSPMDNVVVPAGLVHQVRNTSETEPAKFHVAMASHEPSRELVDRFWSKRAMPADSTGFPGGERVNRFATAPRFEAGPGTQFIDFFNAELIPGFEMSGGYGLFDHKGRLPAHIHDFDESICIIEGTATCVVEGRKYAPNNFETACVPRGRVHYFINDTHDRMTMLWVYAGPMPERIVVDESCATVEGDPWRDAT